MKQDDDSRKTAPLPEDASRCLVRLKVGDAEHTGEVVLAARWSADLGLMPADAGIEFRIVVLSAPSRVTARSIRDPAVAVWSPSPAIAEEAAAYTTGVGVTGLGALLNSGRYLQGRIHTSRGLAFSPARDLAIGGGPVAIDSLGAYVILAVAETYVRLLGEDLPSLTNMGALDASLREFRLFQERFRRDVERTRAELGGLSREFESPLTAGDQRVQDNLLRLAAIRDPVTFARVAREVYGGPAGLAADLESHRRLRRLARLGPEIRSIAHYLDGVSLRPSDDELSVDMISIREQLRVRELAARPHLWDSILDMCRWFKSRYAGLYVQHHKDYYRDVEDCYHALQSVAQQIDAVRKLSEIPQLNTLRARDLASQYQDMLARVRPCKVRDLKEVALAARPVCPSCGLCLSATPPLREVREYMAQSRAALEGQCRRLSVAISRRILRNRVNDKLERLVQVVQVSDLTSLANVLDEELVALLGELLREQPR